MTVEEKYHLDSILDNDLICTKCKYVNHPCDLVCDRCGEEIGTSKIKDSTFTKKYLEATGRL